MKYTDIPQKQTNDWAALVKIVEASTEPVILHCMDDDTVAAARASLRRMGWGIYVWYDANGYNAGHTLRRL